MSNLRKSDNLRRALTWNGKSIAVCSRKELCDCVIHLASQVEVANLKIEQAKKVIAATADSAFEVPVSAELAAVGS